MTRKLPPEKLLYRATWQERFWSRIQRAEGCWKWTGTIDARGYGAIYVKPRVRKAHRLSYELHYGVDPGELEVCHRCDVPACVRPDHLFLGTHADNMADMSAKGRANRVARLRGESVGTAKLTRERVEEAIYVVRSGLVTQASMARHLGVGQTQMTRIMKGHNWAHVERA